MAPEQPIRVRIAPSPTGLLHVGTARAALFNELFARRHGGSFIVRSEDTDEARSKPEFEAGILEGLRWLGLEWEEGPDVGGSYGPYRSSERSATYRTALEQLLTSGHAYVDTREGEIIRLKTTPEPISFTDLVRGEVTASPETWGGDFVIARSMDSALYHLAVVVDDALMAITHVIRGEDHISNTAKHILLQRALGYPQPHYAHVPLILDEHRKKLSKRSGEVSILAYRDMGYLPQAMLNYLALLGWNPGTDREFYTHQELRQQFSLERVQKGGAIFSLAKLNAFNRHYVGQLVPEQLYTWGKFFYESKNLPVPAQAQLTQALLVERERINSYYTDGVPLDELLHYFFVPPQYDPALLIWRKSDAAATLNVLIQLQTKLQTLPAAAFTVDALQQALMNWIDENNLGRGDVLWPLRVALTGREHSPGPFEISAALGKNEVLARLAAAAKSLHTTT